VEGGEGWGGEGRDGEGREREGRGGGRREGREGHGDIRNGNWGGNMHHGLWEGGMDAPGNKTDFSAVTSS
jgi:hypothetical protein